VSSVVISLIKNDYRTTLASLPCIPPEISALLELAVDLTLTSELGGIIKNGVKLLNVPAFEEPISKIGLKTPPSGRTSTVASAKVLDFSKTSR
jgi:hypothetical protein